MSSAGTQIFNNSNKYQASFYGGKINLIFPSPGEFKARLTWVELHNLSLWVAEESLPRVAFVSLMPKMLCIGFPTRFDPAPIWAGVELQPGDLVVHSRGDRFHQIARGRCEWAFVAFDPGFITKHCNLFPGLKYISPNVSRMLRPPLSATMRLRRLHRKICRLVSTNPELVMHREVARAMEDELLQAVVNCLRAEHVLPDFTIAWQRSGTVMNRFEDQLTCWRDKPMNVREISAAIGVSERTLRKCSEEVLGMGPKRYAQLWRLNRVHELLRSSDPATTTVAALAMQFGFSQLGRFAAIYRAAFGENPSNTMFRQR